MLARRARRLHVGLAAPPAHACGAERDGGGCGLGTCNHTRKAERRPVHPAAATSAAAIDACYGCELVPPLRCTVFVSSGDAATCRSGITCREWTPLAGVMDVNGTAHWCVVGNSDPTTWCLDLERLESSSTDLTATPWEALPARPCFGDHHCAVTWNGARRSRSASRTCESPVSDVDAAGALCSHARLMHAYATRQLYACSTALPNRRPLVRNELCSIRWHRLARAASAAGQRRQRRLRRVRFPGALAPGAYVCGRNSAWHAQRGFRS